MTLFDQLQNQKTTELTKATGDGFQVGDVLTSSGGYEQTNAYYYAVTKRTAKTVTFARLQSKVVDERLLPVDAFYTLQGEQQVYKSRRLKAGWKGEQYARVNDWTNAYPWDGKPQYDRVRLDCQVTDVNL